MPVIGSLSVKLGLVTVEWDSATAKAKQQAKDLQKSFEDLTGNVKQLYSQFKLLGGAFSVSAIGLTELMSSTLAFGNEVKDLSQAFDISIEKTLQFRDAIQTSGGSAENASKVISSMFGKIEDARMGNETAIAQMEKLGITFEELKTIKPEEAINRVVQGIANITDKVQQVKAIREVIGRGGIGLDFNELSDKVNKSSKEFLKYAEGIKKFGEVSDNLKTSMDRLKIAFADLVSPLLGTGLVTIEKFKAVLVSIASAAVLSSMVKLIGLVRELWIVIAGGAAITGAVALSLGTVIVSLGSIIALVTALKVFSSGETLEDQLKTLEEAKQRLMNPSEKGQAFRGVKLTQEEKQAAIEENEIEQQRLQALIKARDEKEKLNSADAIAAKDAEATARRESDAMAAKLSLQKQMLGFDNRSADLKIAALTTDQYAIDLAQIKINQESEIAKAEAAQIAALSKVNLSKRERGIINDQYQADVNAANQKAQNSEKLLGAQRIKEIIENSTILSQMDQMNVLLGRENDLKVQSVDMDQYESQSAQIMLGLEREVLSIKQKQQNETVSARGDAIKIAQIDAVAARDMAKARDKAQADQDALTAQKQKEVDLIKLQIAYSKEVSKFDVARIQLDRQRNYMTAFEYNSLTEQLSLMQKLAGFEQRRTEAKRQYSGAQRDLEIEKINAEEDAERKLSAARQESINVEEQRRTSFSDGWNKAFIKYSEDATNYGKMGTEAFNSFASAMESAIDNFVKTGKLAFKDFAKSIIQSLIAIELKMQASQLLRAGLSGISGLFGATSVTGAGGVNGLGAQGLFAAGYADGGALPTDQPVMVGERGPELIIPKNGGTVIPNNQLAGAFGGQQVIYNGPYINTMSAIDTQSAIQFLSANKMGVWAANQSASRSMPTSR
jgi:lambda family phage tail tape measure protein